MENKVDVTYIAGIGHSGSTVLGMKLGSENHRFFIGEAKHFNRTYSTHRCTCGEPLDSCEYWSNLNMSNWHALLQKAKDVKGDQVSELVDSSKDPTVLNRRIKNPNLAVSVVHLIRNPFNHLRRYGLRAFLSWFIAHPFIWVISKWEGVDYEMMAYSDLLKSDQIYDEKIREETFHLFTGNISAVETFRGIGDD